MKNAKLLFCLILICSALTLAVCGCAPFDRPEQGYLRLHIRANSNSEADQAVKLKVRDAVVSYLTPLLADAEDSEEAKKTVKKELASLQKLSESILEESSFGYGASAAVRREAFPTRSYGELVLEGGVYDAVIINLGEGAGDNWWCVAFPPLCFVGEGGDVEYKSILMEIIEKWRKNEEQSN